MYIRNAMVHHEFLFLNFALISWMKQEMKRIQNTKVQFWLGWVIVYLQISFNCKDILNFRCWEAEQQQQQQCGHQLSFTILSRAAGCRGRWRLLGLSTLCGWSPEHWTRSIQTRVPQFWTLTLLKSHYILCYTTVGRFEMPELGGSIIVQFWISVRGT